jgi:hypothetical protein
MAVLIEAISVVLRRPAIERAFPGGWSHFVDFVPNETLCADGELVRVGFMSPTDVKSFVDALEELGLHYIREGAAVDLVIVDQQRGPAAPCAWLEYGHVSLGEAGNRVAAARDPASSSDTLATPEGWSFSGSLSDKFTFAGSEDLEKKLRFLRTEGGLDVYLNLDTGKEVFLGRTA